MQGRDIAIPAVFVVLPGGTIFWKYVGESMSDRPSADEILAIVDRAIAADRGAARAAGGP